MKQDLIKHETKRKALVKFLAVLGVFVIYFAFISFKYGLQQGFFVSSLTWSLFVLGTPVADAGFLIDFPLRLITNVKMVVSEIFVWITAISLNTYAFFFSPEIYTKTKLLVLFKNILEKPFPFWSIILISAIGTFVSIKFGDELLDTKYHHERTFHKKHKNKHGLVVMVFVFVISFTLYNYLLKGLGVELL